MKINQILKGVDGESNLETPDKKNMTLAMVCMTSLLTPMEKDNEKSKMERYDLFLKIREASKRKDGEVDLVSEEIVIIKRSIGVLQPPLIMGQSFKLLEGKPI